jgi:hypothetical protein
MTENSTTNAADGASRRRFLAVAGTGAAVAGVAAMTPLVRADAAPAIKGAKVDGPMVAFVSDAATGEVAIMHGAREVVVHDKNLVAMLTHRLAKGV